MTECDECGGDVTIVFGEHATDGPDGTIPAGKYVQADAGMCLDLSGHYGGFTDSGTEPRFLAVTLCHDCFLKIARLLPNTFPPGGHHPSIDEGDGVSCCEYSWRWADGALEIGDGCGGWRKPEKI